jgi:hypothetical protein
MHNSLVIGEHTIITDTPGDNATSHLKSPDNFFAKNRVMQLITVEHPCTERQGYVASGLSEKCHFSCPKIVVPSLFEAIKHTNNPAVKLLFIPSTVRLCEIAGSIKVINDINMEDNWFINECYNIHEAIAGNETLLTSKALGTSSKRSKFSLSVGL